MQGRSRGAYGAGVAPRRTGPARHGHDRYSTKSSQEDGCSEGRVPRIEPIPLDELARKPRRIIEEGVADGLYATPIPLQIFAYKTSQILMTNAARTAWGQQSPPRGKDPRTAAHPQRAAGRVPALHAVAQARLDHGGGRGLPRRPGGTELNEQERMALEFLDLLSADHHAHRRRVLPASERGRSRPHRSLSSGSPVRTRWACTGSSTHSTSSDRGRRSFPTAPIRWTLPSTSRPSMRDPDRPRDVRHWFGLRQQPRGS